MLSHVLLQFYDSSGVDGILEIIMLFCLPLDDGILCRIRVVKQETWSYSTWLGKCSIHYAYSISTL